MLELRVSGAAALVETHLVIVIIIDLVFIIIKIVFITNL